MAWRFRCSQGFRSTPKKGNADPHPWWVSSSFLGHVVCPPPSPLSCLHSDSIGSVMACPQLQPGTEKGLRLQGQGQKRRGRAGCHQPTDDNLLQNAVHFHTVASYTSFPLSCTAAQVFLAAQHERACTAAHNTQLRGNAAHILIKQERRQNVEPWGIPHL